MICPIPPPNKLFFYERNYTVGVFFAVWWGVVYFSFLLGRVTGSGLGMSMLNHPWVCCSTKRNCRLLSSLSLSATVHLFAMFPFVKKKDLFLYQPLGLQENTRYIKLSLKVSHLSILNPPCHCMWVLYFEIYRKI